MLTDIIDEYIMEKKTGLSHHKFNVSDAGKCHLMRYWKRQGKPATNELDVHTKRISEAGHALRNWFQDVLQRKGVLVEKNKIVEDTHRVGCIDAIIQEGQKLVLYDLRIVKSNRVRFGRGYTYNYMPAYTYAMMLPLDISEVRVAFIARDDISIEEVTVSSDIAEQVVQDWDELIETWETQLQPLPNGSTSECSRCIYRSACLGIII